VTLTKAGFLPCTREVEVGRGVVYRPIRSWHVGTYAGERLHVVGGDRSGCIDEIRSAVGGLLREVCSPPSSAIHRVYWNRSQPDRTISALLSYPHGMSSLPEYFWEAYLGKVERWTGDSAESEMEARIVAEIGDGADIYAASAPHFNAHALNLRTFVESNKHTGARPMWILEAAAREIDRLTERVAELERDEEPGAHPGVWTSLDDHNAQKKEATELVEWAPIMHQIADAHGFADLRRFVQRVEGLLRGKWSAT
jgi:hypothetical protein